MGKSEGEEAGEAGRGPESRALGAIVRSSSTERGETVETECGAQWVCVSPQCRDTLIQVAKHKPHLACQGRWRSGLALLFPQAVV